MDRAQKQSAALRACDQRRWHALYFVCIGVLAITLSGTIVNGALAAIRADLDFSDRSLIWSVNGYAISFGGCLLLCGRLGDCYGYRRCFLAGVGVFACTSLICGIAQSQTAFIAARFVQGLGAAAGLAVALSLILEQFTTSSERARAIGIFSFACAGGNSAGPLLGGILTSTLGWRWIFLMNIPLGIAVYVSCRMLLSPTSDRVRGRRIDTTGAVAVTASMVLADYAVLRVPEDGWLSSGVLLPMIGAFLLLGVFITHESRTPQPLIAPGLFDDRNFSAGLVAGMLWCAAMAAWFYIAALYLLRVLEYAPMEAGLAFLPVSLIVGIFSIRLSAALVTRCGVRSPCCIGILLSAVGLLLFARSPDQARFVPDVLPGMIMIGLGTAVAYNPLMSGAVRAVGAADYGIASGVLNSAFVMAGSVALTVFGSLTAARTDHLIDSGVELSVALNNSCHLAFGIGALLSGLAALIALIFLSAETPAGADPAAGSS